MSVDYLYVIPADPRWTPDPAREAAALAVFGRVDAEDIEVERHGGVQFYSAVENFDTATCPACGTTLFDVCDFTWFREQIDRIWSEKDGFWPLDVVTPCCGGATSLNDLGYEPAQGFASWGLRATDPRGDVDDRMRAELTEALGQPIRVVRAHM